METWYDFSNVTHFHLLLLSISSRTFESHARHHVHDFQSVSITSEYKYH